MKNKKVLETPEGKTNTIATKIDEYDMKLLMQYYKSEFDIAVDARTSYVNRQLKWYKKRYGIRAKTTFPWPGASNLHVPLQDKTVRKLKPEFVNIIYNVLPMVDMTHFGGSDEAAENEISQKAAWQFDWLLRDEMEIFAEVNESADKTLSKGFCIPKVIYEKTYEPITKIAKRTVIEEQDARLLDPENKEDLVNMLAELYELDPEDDVEQLDDIASRLILGEDLIEFTVYEATYDAPKVVILSPEEVVVPKDTISVFDLERARWICHPIEYTAEDLILNSRGKDAKWDREVVKEILGKDGIDPDKMTDIWEKFSQKGNFKDSVHKSDISLQADLREGISGVDRPTYLVYEFCCWFDSDNDGLPERHVLDFCDRYMEKELRFVKYHPSIRLWPYRKIPYEIADQRHLSPRGTIEILDPLAKSLNIRHNQKINTGTIETAMNYWYVPDKVSEENIDFVFNRGIPVKEPNALGMLQTNTGSSAFYTQDEAAMKAWAEEYIASSDGMNASVINPIPSSGQRTKYELQSGQASRQPVQQLDLQIFQHGWKGVFYLIWAFWMQYGPLEELSVKMKDKITRMTRDEVAGKYNITPNGRIGSTDPDTESRKAQARLAAYAGDIYYDQYELKYDALMKDDPRLVGRLLRPKEVVGELIQMQQQIQQLTAQNEALAKGKMIDATVQEKTKKPEVKQPANNNKPVQPAGGMQNAQV